MRVKLIKRWGPTPAGESVDVDPTQGRWLIDHAFGTAQGEPAPKQEAFKPGEAGSDPLASGDGSRQGTPTIVKGERRDNNAAALAGSPLQYNAGIASSETSAAVVEGGEDSARGEVSAQHKPVASDRPSQTGRRRKAATPENSATSGDAPRR